MSRAPYAYAMTEAFTAALSNETALVVAVDDPVDRFEAIRAMRQVIAETDRVLRGAQGRTVLTLKEGRTWAEVGALVGVTGSRAEQISRYAQDDSHTVDSTERDESSP